MKTTDFPNDPELIAAIEAVYAMCCVTAPAAWHAVTESRRVKVNNRPKKRRILAERDGSQCAYCGTEFDDPQDATLDHVIPLRLMKNSTLVNLVLSCEPCNAAKSDRIPAFLMPLLSALVLRLARLNAAPVERCLVPVGGA